MRRYNWRGTGALTLELPKPIPFTLQVQAPKVGPEDRLFLAANINGWNSQSERYAFKRVGEDRFELPLRVLPNTHMEFKVTRGGWERVEVKADGEDVDNRILRIRDEGAFEVTIEDWRDNHPRDPKPKTTVGNVKSLGKFTVAPLGRTREIVAYLPPGYDVETSRRYPVLYMFDGQNLFDERTSFSGEWYLDETCEKLITDGKIPPIIIIAIYHGNQYRLSELAPWPDYRLKVKAEGEKFIGWVARDLKHQIDQKLRTLPDREYTAVGGSSMGGLAAMYAGFRYRDVFGRVMSMSGSFWFGERSIFSFLRDCAKPYNTKIYLDCGGKEGGSLFSPKFLRHANDMVDLLKKQGFTEDRDLKYVVDKNATHSEAEWARRAPVALEYLWGDLKL